MTQLWKKIIHIFGVLFVAATMVFSFLEPKTTVVAEEGQDNGGTAVSTASPQSTSAPVNTSAPTNTAVPDGTPAPSATPAQTPLPTVTADPINQTYAITVDPIDTEDAYFDDETSTLHIVPGGTAPFRYQVHDGGDPNGEVIKGAEVQVDIGNLPVRYDSTNNTLTAGEGGTDYDFNRGIVLKYGDSIKRIHVDICQRYSGGLSENSLRMEPQTTSEEVIHLTVYDTFKNVTEIKNPDYEVSEGPDDHVTFDKATGKVTSYDQYGTFTINFSYKDFNTTLYVYVYAPVQSISFTNNEINLKVNDYAQLNDYLQIEPYEAREAKQQVTSDNPNVVTTNDSLNNDFQLMAVGEGVAKVTVTADGVSATVKVIVTAAGTASEIQFDPEYESDADTYRDIFLKSGETKELKAYLFDNSQKDVTESAKNEITYSMGYMYNPDGNFELNGDTVKATGNGNAQITASIGNGWRKEITWNVHVTDKEPDSISFTQDEYRVHLGSKYSDFTQYVYLNGKPDGINMGDIEYSVKSDDESMVKINGRVSNWYLDPVKTGTTTITATTSNGKKATAKVTVDQGDYANYISSDSMDKAIPLKPGETFTLEPLYILPDGKTTTVKPADEKVTYEVPKYLRQYVKLTENKDGTATVKALDFNNSVNINATLTNGQSAQWRIQITPDITSLHFRKKEITFTDETEYNDLSQYLNIQPSKAYGSELAWSSDNIKVATVDNNGYVHIIKYDADVNITASTKDGKIKDIILVHCKKAVAPQKIISDRGNDINLYVGYETTFFLSGIPDYASTKYKIQINDPNGVTDLDPGKYSDEDYNSSFYVEGKKIGEASITVSSVKDPSVKKVIRIHVLDGKPSDKDIDLDYVILNGGGYGSDDPDYDPAIDLFKDDKAIGKSIHPAKYTFIKDGYYTIVTRYKNWIPVDGSKKVLSGPLKIGGFGVSWKQPSGYTLEDEGIIADEAGEGVLQFSDGRKIEYQVVDAEVSDKPEIDTGNADDELKKEIKNITNESIGMNGVLQNAVNTMDLSNNKKVQDAAANLRDKQELKVEITNVIKYESVEGTGENKKITVSITPKYVVKVVNTETGGQEGHIIDEGEAEVNQNVTLRVPVGKDLNGSTLYIRHIKKNGTSRIYEGTVDENGELVFDNPDGFSTFVITADDPSTVKFGTTGYESLQDALNNGLVQGTVTVLKGYKGKTDVTVKREMAFKLDNQSGKTFNIKAGDGYTLSQDGNNYTITQNYQKDDDDTKPDWGTPVFTFTDNGTKAIAVRTNKKNGSQTQTLNADVKQTEKTDPTCTEKGRTVYTATAVFDGQTYTDQYVAEIDALGHDLQHVPAVPSTKDKEGNIEYWKCTRCGKYFSDANGTQEIDPKSVVTPASKLESIAWSEEPSDEQKSWTEGTSFHYAGKAVLTYEDGETVSIDVTNKLFDVEGYNPDQLGEQNVTLKLKSDNSFTLSETVTVNAKVETGIQASAKKTVLTIDQIPEKSDLKVERLFNNGTTEVVSDDAYEIAYTAPEFNEQEILDKTVKKSSVIVTETATGYTASVEFDVKPAEYKLKEGNNASVVLEKNQDYSFHLEASFDKFQNVVVVDGNVVDPSNYTAVSGSTVVTLKASYLNTLKEGRHTIQIVLKDGVAEGTFTVQAKASEQKNNDQKNGSVVADTSDHSNVGLYGGTLVCAVIAVAAVLWIRRKHA